MMSQKKLLLKIATTFEMLMQTKKPHTETRPI